MRRLIALVAGALVAARVTVAPAQPAQADSTTVKGLPYGTEITLNFPTSSGRTPFVASRAQ